MKNYSYQRLKKICLENADPAKVIAAATEIRRRNLWIETKRLSTSPNNTTTLKQYVEHVQNGTTKKKEEQPSTLCYTWT